jgi:hypothetical protein
VRWRQYPVSLLLRCRSLTQDLESPKWNRYLGFMPLASASDDLPRKIMFLKGHHAITCHHHRFYFPAKTLNHTLPRHQAYAHFIAMANPLCASVCNILHSCTLGVQIHITWQHESVKLKVELVLVGREEGLLRTPLLTAQ